MTGIWRKFRTGRCRERETGIWRDRIPLRLRRKEREMEIDKNREI